MPQPPPPESQRPARESLPAEQRHRESEFPGSFPDFQSQSFPFSLLTLQPLSGIIQITAGGSHTCALTAASEVYCWGSNRSGEAGIGGYSDLAAPVIPVPGLSGISAIAAGKAHTCALTGAGTVYCWGYNYFGQLGDGTTTSSPTPVQVSGLSNATAIAAGEDHTCALVIDGTVRCWGMNWYGQLGDGTLGYYSLPIQVMQSLPVKTYLHAVRR
ncbi:hypothetical protein [Anaerolinea sp.]|uniref:RCC1 domain-containing protein n=1 Tax=Anaerolinea sp. TaxID=1872519 RepID=UPI002ACE518A|nr:hypothetical protein [Anaerolinea sp.]